MKKVQLLGLDEMNAEAKSRIKDTSLGKRLLDLILTRGKKLGLITMQRRKGEAF